MRCLMLLLLIIVQDAYAVTNKWLSQATGSSINCTITDPSTPQQDAAGNMLTIVYLENLPLKKIGRNSNQQDVAWLLKQGYRVVELNYNEDIKAVAPAINQDIISINKQLSNGLFCGLTNCSRLQSYVLFEGYRIKRNVAFFKDNPAVYNPSASYTDGDSLYLDIVYPANPKKKIPVILSFSYSNSYPGQPHQRMRLDYTLAGFNDSFLEGAPAYGFAWAIADHPKYCQWGKGQPPNGRTDTYKSYQTNPDAAQKVKSAVRTLRWWTARLGLANKIGIYGFSRGSTAGSLAIGDKKVPEFEDAGLLTDLSSRVQAAALGPGVFDYTWIYNVRNDGDANLETRCPWAWGNLEDNPRLWQTMGAANLAETKATAPVLFFYNTNDERYYQEQINHFKARLDSLRVPTSTLINYGHGHAVPKTDDALVKLYTFFQKHCVDSFTAFLNLEVQDRSIRKVQYSVLLSCCCS